MKFRNILIIIIIGILSFFYLDIQQIVAYVYNYVTKVEEIEIEKESSPVILGKPCITNGGTAYYYPNNQSSGYIIVNVKRVSEKPPQALVIIDKIKTGKPFKYNDVKYYRNEKLWLPINKLLCKSP